MLSPFRDKDGRKLLVFCVFKHVKGSEKMEDMKKFFVYMLERLDREEQGEQITLLFDCRTAGLRNMDMEFVQFIIGTLKEFYPDPLNYILVLEMPWVLNGELGGEREISRVKLKIFSSGLQSDKRLATPGRSEEDQVPDEVQHERVRG